MSMDIETRVANVSATGTLTLAVLAVLGVAGLGWRRRIAQ